MHDIECPYCGKEQNINHDDGYGYEEDRIHNQQCNGCDKYFTFTTAIIYHYEAGQAPCLNNGEHNWKNVQHFPVSFPNWKRCECCGEEIRGEFVRPYRF